MNDQAQMMNQPQLMMMNPVQPQLLTQNPAVLVQPQPPMMMNQRSFESWPPLQQSMDPNNKFPLKFNSNANFNFIPSKHRSNKNWKGRAAGYKDQRRMPVEKPNAVNPAGPSVSGGYNPPSLNDLQTQNRMKARKYYNPKKKFNNRFAPYAPRNTTSFIIRAKKAGGIASLVSPCPVTPAVLPTPMFSPSREVLGDMAKEEWGVDGYGSMKGLIRLRSPGSGHDDDDEEEEDGNDSSESDVEEHVEVERRLDHDLSRFEMIYPNYGGAGVDCNFNNVLENRVDDQGSHIAQLEEENLTLKERLFLMERELADLRRRMHFLERQHGHNSSARSMAVEYVNEEIVENVSENDENGSDDNNDELMEYDGVDLEARKSSKHEIIPYHEETGKDGVEKENSESENVELKGNVAVKDEFPKPDVSEDKLDEEKNVET